MARRARRSADEAGGTRGTAQARAWQSAVRGGLVLSIHPPHQPFELVGSNRWNFILPPAPRTVDKQHHCTRQPPWPLPELNALGKVNSIVLLTSYWQRVLSGCFPPPAALALGCYKPPPAFLEARADWREGCREHQTSVRPVGPGGNPFFALGLSFPPVQQTAQGSPETLPYWIARVRVCFLVWAGTEPTLCNRRLPTKRKSGAVRP